MSVTSSTGQTVKDTAEQMKNNVVNNINHEEGTLTRKIEEQTAKVPSVSYLGLAVGSMVISAGLTLFAKKRQLGNFVGLWAPCFLMLGLYNKLVKVAGSDQYRIHAED